MGVAKRTTEGKVPNNKENVNLIMLLGGVVKGYSEFMRVIKK